MQRWFIPLFLLCPLVLSATFTLEFAPSDLIFSKVGQYDLVTLRGAGMTTDIGRPCLPLKTVHVAIPRGTRAISVRVLEIVDDTLEGYYRILPTQPPKPTVDKTGNLLVPDDLYYESPAYPNLIVQIAGSGDIAGQPLVALNVAPLTYIAKKGQLIFHKLIRFEIETAPAETPRSVKLTPYSRHVYGELLKNLVLNPEDVNLISAPPKNSKLNPGDYDYVIITTPTLQSYWDSLRFWKRRKGVKDTLITTTWIYSNYTGSSNAEKIRNFIIDANSTWGAIWFLIGGDADFIPMSTKSFVVNDTVYEVPSDYYYADYDDDWYQEVFVGRVPADNSGQISIFINKLRKYEENPPLTNYILKILFIGMDLDALTYSEDNKDYIDNYYVPSRFTITKVYDSDDSNHKTDAINALNSGQNLVNHSDHADYDLLGVGISNHGWALYISDIDGLTNNDKASVVYSMGCWSNAFDFSDAISEHFIVYNPSRAGVAYIGNTRYGWYETGTYNTLSMLMDREWWRSLFSYNKYRVGEALADSKNRNYPTDDCMRYVHYELCLLGDPEMPIWTDTPESLDVTHPSEITVTTESFTVTVTSDGYPVSNAFVCLYKEGEVYERGYTDSNGEATFTINPATPGTLYVTVTKQNYLPYEGTCNVINQPLHADFTASPTTGRFPLTVNFTDQSTGDITSWHWFFGDGEESYEQNPVHTYTSEGSFDVTLIVSGPQGSDTAFKEDFIVITCNNSFVPETVMVAPSQHFSAKVFGVTDTTTTCFQMCMAFDPALIRVDSVTLHGTVFDTAWGGSGPDHFGTYIDNDVGRWDVAVLYSFATPPDKFLRPLSGEALVTVYYTLSDTITPPDTIYLYFSDSLGSNVYGDSTGHDVFPCLFPQVVVVISEPMFIRGDANANGDVNITDCSYMLSHLVPVPDFPCVDAADCNDDGSISIVDASYLLNHMFPSLNLPPPNGTCGTDPTSDDLGCDSFPPCGSKRNTSFGGLQKLRK